ncbi:ATP-binding cassette domain-containing protein [Epibacterium sp. SM1979]|uniref:ATP-binding cassette domain-containing protein n=1 Tax=Tritonibacter litoralis TaxID=2662264 RepID=A0A843YLN1_9RHOB|nr:ATP-binding cassette domain-containing protein [Tritonibacter litoralis]MQQ10565.1 ATP-binding cassette domain-containing protein [Tritonibacter litoralis]
MLTVTDITVSIQGTTVLKDASLSVAAGQTCGLIGRNGAGKTTLMRAIMGALPFTGQGIFFRDHDLAEAKAHNRAEFGIGYLPEDRRLVPHFTVEENIMVPLWAAKSEDRARVKWVYDLMPEIGRFADRRAMTLSGGQQKLVALARSLVAGHQLLLLDEPFEGVAPALAQRLMEVVADLKSENLSVLVSDSDYTHSKRLVDKVYTIERGQVTIAPHSKAA